MTKCSHGSVDAELVELIISAKSDGWKGPAAERCTAALWELARPLIRKFPKLHPDEVRNETWAAASHPKLTGAVCAQGWIRARAFRALIKAVGEQRRDTRLWTRLVVEYRENLAVPGADSFVDAEYGRPVGHIWADLGQVLSRLCWPMGHVGSAVAALQEAVEMPEGKINVDVAASVLDEAGVPDGLKRPLIRFVFDEDGYVQARLGGFSAQRTVKLSAMQPKLRKLIWKPSYGVEQLRPVAAADSGAA